MNDAAITPYHQPTVVYVWKNFYALCDSVSYVIINYHRQLDIVEKKFVFKLTF